MNVTGSRTYRRPTPTPKMPLGLVELMEGLTKDVLKHNPEDVYEFCARHMQKLLDIRDGAPPKKQMSLEQKIKKAQEKIRQKIKNRRLQEVTKRLNETVEQEKNVTKIELLTEFPLGSTDSSRQLVHHEEDMVMGHDELEISHEPNVIIAATDIHKEEKVFEEHKPVSKTTIQSANSNNVKEEVEETSVDIKGSLTLSETPRNDALTNKLEEDVNISSVYIKESKPIISLALQNNESAYEVKEKEKVLTVETTPLTSEMPQSDEEMKKITHVKIKGNKSGSNTPGSDIEPIINAPDNLNGDEVTVRDLQLTLRHDLSLHSKETFEPNEVIVDDIAKLNSKYQVEPVAPDSKTIDEELTKNDSDRNEVISFQQHNEIFHNEILSDKVKPTQTHDIEDEIKSIDNNAITIDGENSKNENYDKHIKSEESNTETTPPESILESGLVKTIIKGQQLCDKKRKPEAETGEQVQFVEGHKLNQELLTESDNKISITDGNKNLDHSNDQENVKHQNDFDRPKNESNIIDTVTQLLEQERQFSSELITKENNIFAHTASIINDKNETKIESNESTENQAGTGMDLETAAITIQKVFRTFMFSKSRASTLEDTVNENYLDEEIEKKDEPEYIIPSANLNKERRVLGLSRMDTVLQTVNEEKSLSLSTDDSSTLSSAATTIQAHVKGFLARHKLASYKTASGSSLVNSEGPTTVSLDDDTNEPKKTILNIHIVPERGQFMSRDESMLTSIDLPLDNSPPSSVNLHPLGYDKSEPRKQLKREDAIQSVSPPSNNSGKLSEEVDSVKDTLIDNSLDLKPESENAYTALATNNKHKDFDAESCDTTLTISSTADTVIEAEIYNAREILSSPELNSETGIKDTVTNFSSDEMDVVTPFPSIAEINVSSKETVVDDKPKLVHTGEFHDIVVQTQVKRSESSVVRGE